VNPANYLILSALLFTIGAVGVLVRRNAIVVFMSIELMLNAVNLTLITFSRITGNADGQIHRLLRDGRRRGGGGDRTGDHPDHLPHAPLRLGGRRQPAQVLTGGHTHMSVRDATVCPAGGLGRFSGTGNSDASERRRRGEIHPASGAFSGLWLLLVLPLAGAAVLLLGGRRLDRHGHLIGCAAAPPASSSRS